MRQASGRSMMRARPRRLLLVAAAIAVPIALTATVTHLAYHVAEPPFTPDWPLYALWLSLLLGTALLWRGAWGGTSVRFALVAIYVPASIVVLWVVAYATGCYNGDC